MEPDGLVNRAGAYGYTSSSFEDILRADARVLLGNSRNVPTTDVASYVLHLGGGHTGEVYSRMLSEIFSKEEL